MERLRPGKSLLLALESWLEERLDLDIKAEHQIYRSKNWTKRKKWGEHVSFGTTDLRIKMLNARVKSRNI